MGANPMQKMKRNSLLTGLLVGLGIGLILCVIIYLFFTQTTDVPSMNKSDLKSVCVLKRDIKSGETITLEDISQKVMSVENLPTDVVTISSAVVSKIDLSSGTVLTKGMLNATNDILTADLREQEYNMIALPTNLAMGDFVDIRLQLPNGGDYIVVSKKQVLNCNASTIWLNMYEEEINLMSCAIIEYYIMTGSKLYATTYVEPGMQTASVKTYVPNQDVKALIDTNPNIVNRTAYLDQFINIRNEDINEVLRNYSDNRLQNIEENIQKEMKDLKESREEYFKTLNSAY